VNPLAQRLLKTIRKQAFVRPGDRLAAAVSGGADSVALLLLLLDLRSELGIVLSVAHVNHKLRGDESDADEQFVKHLAEVHGLDCHVAIAPVVARDAGIEAAARELRYDFFRRLAQEHRIRKVATAHTLDDQAETVLMRIMRGTGIRGLAGIHPRLNLFATAQDGASPATTEVVRPLLGFRRDELRRFLHLSNRIWREDPSNLDPQFFRNRVRHEVIPFLATLSGSIAENLAELASIARAEDEHWDAAHPDARAVGGPLDLSQLAPASAAGQRRLLLNWLRAKAPESHVSFRLIEELLDLAADGEPGKAIELPAGYVATRSRKKLHLDRATNSAEEGDYEYSLTVPGAVEVWEIGVRIEALIVNPAAASESPKDCLLDSGRLPGVLTVRNWRPGDRFWPAHTKEPKKVKDLLNDRHITGREKKLWPVIVSGGQLVWMRGFPVPADFQPGTESLQAVQIREAKLG
jgi:tRNA(Ile)-lysidine synthase